MKPLKPEEFTVVPGGAPLDIDKYPIELDPLPVQPVSPDLEISEPKWGAP